MQWSAAIVFPCDRTALRDDIDCALTGLDIDQRACGQVWFSRRFRDERPTPPRPQATSERHRPPAVPSNAEDIAAGQKLFNENCAHCHGPNAVQGEQRRNLRLLRQRYGEELPQTFIFTVTHGRVSKGMPNWSGIITSDEFEKILAFLTSVQEPAP